VRLTVLMLIVLSGLFLRLDQAWLGSESNMPDSAAYERIARGVSEHGEFEQYGAGTPAHPQPASNYSPGLPLLVAGIFELSGDHDVRLARLLLALVSAAAIPISWRIGCRLGGDLAGLAAAAITAFYPTLIADSGMLLTEPLAGTLVAGAILAILRARERTSPAAWILPGVLLGLTSTVRPEALLLSATLAVVLVGLEYRSGFRRALVPVAVMSASLLLIVAPFVARDLGRSGRLTPVSTGGGQTLFTGSFSQSGGDPTIVAPMILEARPDLAAKIDRQNRSSGEGPESVTADRVLGLLARERHPDLSADAALALMGRDSYAEQIGDDPLSLAAYVGRKAGRIWWRGRVDLIESLQGRILHRSLIALLLIGLATLGIKRRPEFWILGGPLLSATLVGAILVASPRRVLALWPLVGVLSGVGLAGLVHLGRNSLSGRLGQRSHSLTAPDARNSPPTPVAARR
jgi:Dolichyl-phosphate-mannose-protein mannosyltransferase